MAIETVIMLTVSMIPPMTSLLHNILAMNDGKCICDAEFSPVCGTDGNTYTNACVLRCFSQYLITSPMNTFEIYRPEACIKNFCHCSPYINYICGSDQYTYINRCYLLCHNKRIEQLQLPFTVDVSSREQCKNIQYCINDVYPVCGSDSKTYRNLCFLQYASNQNLRNDLPLIYLKSWGPCHVEICPCPFHVNPVCGSNDREYSNYCIFNCEKRRRVQLNLSPLTIKNNGPCEDDCVCEGKSNDPVCGSDSKTYSNQCHLYCANKKRATQGLPPVTVISDVACDCSCSIDDYNPICASDYKTYRNLCELGCANNIRKFQNLMPLRHVSNDECETCTCSHYYIDPVCSSDGRNFNNPCLLICENRRREMQGLLALTHTPGPCPHTWNYIYDPVCANSNELSNPCFLVSELARTTTTEDVISINS